MAVMSMRKFLLNKSQQKWTVSAANKCVRSVSSAGKCTWRLQARIKRFSYRKGGVGFGFAVFCLVEGGNHGPVFRKSRELLRARKAFRKTTSCLFCKAGLLICCKGNENKNNCKVSCLETPSFLRYKENCHPKYARKVSGLSRNRPLNGTRITQWSNEIS